MLWMLIDKPWYKQTSGFLTVKVNVTRCVKHTEVNICNSYFLIPHYFGGLVVSMLASGTEVRGFKPGRSRRIFSGEKILSMPSFAREVKLFAPCRRFVAC
jgi:hypothetical protein